MFHSQILEHGLLVESRTVIVCDLHYFDTAAPDAEFQQSCVIIVLEVNQLGVLIEKCIKTVKVFISEKVLHAVNISHVDGNRTAVISLECPELILDGSNDYNDYQDYGRYC